jgi:hypothetical protein
MNEDDTMPNGIERVTFACLVTRLDSLAMGGLV